MAADRLARIASGLPPASLSVDLRRELQGLVSIDPELLRATLLMLYRDAINGN
ncbi:hypothetical protein XS42_004598 [Salmonella enterica subsp. enterica]|nr:hypothetical protein [Salmonella enterica subsp. enterica]